MAGGKAFFAVPFDGADGHSHHRGADAIPGRGFEAADFGSGFVAIDAWHLAVHQHQVEAACAQCFNCLTRARDDLAHIAEFAYGPQRYNLVHRIVIDDQNIAFIAGRSR